MGEHVQQEQGLAVADARQTGAEAAGRPALVLGFDRGLVPLPVLAVGRIGDQVVERLAGMAVVGEGASESDVFRVAARRVLHEDVGLGDRPGLRVHLLAEEMDLRLRIDGGTNQLAVAAHAAGDVLLGDHQHAAGTAAGVVDRAHHPGAGDLLFVTGKHEVHHQMDDVAGREVLAGVFVQGLVEAADQLLEDRPHARVVDRVRMQIDAPEPLQHLEQQPASSSLLMVLSKSNRSSTSRMFGLKPAM